MTAVTEAATIELLPSMNERAYSLTSVASGQTLATPFSKIYNVQMTINGANVGNGTGCTVSSGTITFKGSTTNSLWVLVKGL